MTAAASDRVRVRPGRRFPLGATPGPGGTNFAVASGVELIPQGDGTLVRLTHRDLPPGEVPAHQAGWSHYLDRLAVRAGGADPGSDPWAAAPPAPPTG